MNRASTGGAASLPLLSLRLEREHDVVAARQRTRQITDHLGFTAQDQTRLATAVSEISRNAFRYARHGRVDFWLEGRPVYEALVIRVADTGPGIPNLADVLEGRYHSNTGMGLGIVGSRRLVDHFHIESSEAGTIVFMRKLLPARAPAVTPARLTQMMNAVARSSPEISLEEIEQQNQALLETLEELRVRQDELTRLNQELEDTNRGVVALYAELDEKAEHLRRADELKSRFLSNMSHEFRTPLNSILALSRLLLERSDGDLNGEQERQVGYIRRAAEDLYEMVNDLLDLAKVEAGKIEIRPSEFHLSNLLGALRGMMRPLLTNPAVNFTVEEPAAPFLLFSDEAKLAQILRNFISNALKFTERGEVRVSASRSPDGETITLAVSDTGIGIAPEDHERIFQEFSQVLNPLQKRVRGTGLGLPLSRRLAELLGGRITVESQPGAGSTFCAHIPVFYRNPALWEGSALPASALEPGRLPVLILESRLPWLLTIQRCLQDTEFQPLHCRAAAEAQSVLNTALPVAALLSSGGAAALWQEVLERLRSDPRFVAVPILTLDDGEPYERGKLLTRLRALSGWTERRRILVIDDDDIPRYVLRQHLRDLPFVVFEAANGADGLERARHEQPHLILLDLSMPGIGGWDILSELKADPATQSIPVVVHTSRPTAEVEADPHFRLAQGLLPKGGLTRESLLAMIRTVPMPPAGRT